jgi:SAM-dependent methyltransferase
MSEIRESVLARLRRHALALSLTPLHPQWFSFRAKAHVADLVVAAAAGCFLDIGCGEGALRRRIASRCRYLGLDSMVTGQAMYRACPDVFADASRLPFREAIFDAVALLDVLEHLAEPRAALREIGRVLKPGGSVYISVPCLYPLHDEPFDYQRPTFHGLRHWLEDAGFEVIAIEGRGAPAETAALFVNIALAHLVTRAISRFSPFALLAVVAAPMITVVNLLGWLIGRASGSAAFMPYSYWAVARRTVL